MTRTKILIANRGEIAVRIARTAADLGLATVAVYATDDAGSSHRSVADIAVPLTASGPRAYLDGAALIAAALEAGATAIHPGYGFLSESAPFASAVAAAGLTFIGPTPDTLALLGDKAAARALALKHHVPLLAGSNHATTLPEAIRFFETLPAGAAMMIKALAGGGGRGIRLVQDRAGLDDAYARCRSEALHGFGNDAVYVEEAMKRARHIEVQIVGDGSGAVTTLGERECTLQRRHQKIVEFAPSPSLHASVRDKLFAAAKTMAAAIRYKGLGTFEFLVDAKSDVAGARVAFIEANARLQVEHTVTEHVFDLDLVALQFKIAAGATLEQLGLMGRIVRPAGRAAVQVRINAETMAADGTARPQTGTISRLALPGGPRVRVDTHIYDGFAISPAYDSLIAKVIVETNGEDHAALMRKAARALSEFRLGGVATNASFLRALLAEPAVQQNNITTRFIETHAGQLLTAAQDLDAAMAASMPQPAADVTAPWKLGDGTVVSPLPGSIVTVSATAGDAVSSGQTLAVIESMKMEHLITAPRAGIIQAVRVGARDVVREGQPLFDIATDETVTDVAVSAAAIDLDHIRPDLQAVFDRHAFTRNEHRGPAVEKRQKMGMRTARDNVEDLVDPGSFIEYGALMVAAQRQRRGLDDLVRNTPADGLIAGIGTVNAATTTAEQSRVAVMAYDYTVLAGTQGKLNHKKSDRLLDVAEQWKLPVVLFAEGGGGRPGDTDWTVGVAGLDCTTFHRFGALSGLMPRVGIVAGRCFAGNAALLGSADVVIATRNSSIGMGGPAMIEGGGLGVVRARRGRPGLDAGAERRDRHSGR